MKVRITVLKKEFYLDYAEEYLTDGAAAGPCPLLKEGDVFLYTGNAAMPEGFCPWAWADLWRAVSILAGSKKVDNDWYRRKGTTIECCTDGVRPVIFKLEQWKDGAK